MNMKTKFSCLKVLRPPMSSTGQRGAGRESGNTGKEGVREAGGERAGEEAGRGNRGKLHKNI